MFEKVLSQPSVQAELEPVGLYPGFLGPQEFAVLAARKSQILIFKLLGLES